MREWLLDAWRFAVAVVVQWWSVSLAVLGFLGIIDYFFEWKVGWRKFAQAGLAFLLVGAFLAWRDQYTARMSAEKAATGDESEDPRLTPVPPEPPCQSFLAKTPEQIWDEGKSRSASEQADGTAWSKYEHACVQWTLPLKTLEMAKGDTAIVSFGAGRIGLLTVETVIQLRRYPQLKLAHQGERIEVRGRITWVQVARMALHDAALTFPESEPTPTTETPRTTPSP